MDRAQLYHDMTTVELNNKLTDLKQELFNLRFQHTTGQLKNPLTLQTVKKDIARVMTILRERESGIHRTAKPTLKKVVKAESKPEAKKEEKKEVKAEKPTVKKEEKKPVAAKQDDKKEIEKLTAGKQEKPKVDTETKKAEGDK